MRVVYALVHTGGCCDGLQLQYRTALHGAWLVAAYTTALPDGGGVGHNTCNWRTVACCVETAGHGLAKASQPSDVKLFQARLLTAMTSGVCAALISSAPSCQQSAAPLGF